MTLITDSATLAAFCTRLKAESFVTVDTEFMRDRTYWPRLCLVQVGGEEEAAAIDPLASGIDLTPLLDLMGDTAVLKVMHAARQDLEIFYRLGRMPLPLFYTQVAAMVCGFGEEVAYDTLVQPPRQGPSRQELPLHRLGKAPPDPGPDHLRPGRRHPIPAHGLPGTCRGDRAPRPHRLGRGGALRPHRPRPLRAPRPRRPGSASDSAPSTASSWPSSRSSPPGASRKRGAATCRAPASSATTS